MQNYSDCFQKVKKKCFNFISAQETKKENKPGDVYIQTSAECGSCKKRIEEKLNYTKGVRFAELDLRDKVLHVKFSTKKISLEEIKNILSETGYDADDVKANPKAVKELPACCQPGGMSK